MPRVLRAYYRCETHRMKSDGTGYAICLKCGFHRDEPTRVAENPYSALVGLQPAALARYDYLGHCARCGALERLWYARNEAGSVVWLCEKCEERGIDTDGGRGAK